MKKWTEEEDEILCTYCVERYVVEMNPIPINDIVSRCLTKQEFKGRNSGSIRMRIQNVKAVLEKHKIFNTIPVKPLSHNGIQTENTLLKILRQMRNL